MSLAPIPACWQCAFDPARRRKLFLQGVAGGLFLFAILHCATAQRARSDARSEAGTEAVTAPPQWQSLGPQSVLSPDFGLLSGRITALALDPNDPTGNRLYMGTTGGGVWRSQNAASSDSGQVVFTPLTDNVDGFSGKLDPSLSIGALSVQPGGTGVVLAGTGDPNNALDSYYGGGILRSTDGGNTWAWIQKTSDLVSGFAAQDYGLMGEAFAGFAWSTADTDRVVAAVAHARRSSLVGAEWSGFSYAGLYYSLDAGATWHLATVSDGNGQNVQAPLDAMSGLHGNAAVAVVWNPVRKLFLAAIQLHGYYQSSDGVTWTRLAEQPGKGLTLQQCPTNYTWMGSATCPLQRGALAVNPVTGDTFAWTIDSQNQDQGLWQDLCNRQGSACTNPAIKFAKQWDTGALQFESDLGAATIDHGDYNLALAAIPSSGDTVLLAADDDLWKCSLSAGCAWRNTTHSSSCKSAQVAPHQHAIEWNASRSSQIFLGTDGGLWRSTDLIGETDAECSETDADHLQNLNAGVGSLAQVGSFAVNPVSPDLMIVGLGVLGAAGVKDSVPTTTWPTVLGGYGGSVAIDPANPDRWYVNNGQGVSIYRCSQSAPCTPSDFGASPMVSSADVSGDAASMTQPAPFLVDPQDPSQLLIGTCRVWRGPADGIGWSSTNAISPILDTSGPAGTCSAKAMIRSLAALPLANGGEVVYAGMYGANSGGQMLPGHIFTATLSPSGTWSKWQDLTANPVANDTEPFNRYGYDLSSIFVDPHDAAGSTVYVTVAGFPNDAHTVRMVYRSVDAGAHWARIASNLLYAPANSLVIDPFDANTAYVATDLGVFATRNVSSCGQPAVNCWAAYGAGLPLSPVAQLATSSPNSSTGYLVAATYGRGLWLIPLFNSATPLTTASLTPASLSFSDQPQWTTSSAQTITLTNIGNAALILTSIATTGDFIETDNCLKSTVALHGSCNIQIQFAPTALGARSGQVTINANVAGGSLGIGLAGNATAPNVVSLMPDTLDFGPVTVGATSYSLQITVENSGAASVPITSLSVTPPFTLASNACGTTALAAHSDCQLTVRFTAAQAGAASGRLTLVDALGTQTAELSGVGTSPATDTLSPSSLTFADTAIGQSSTAQTVSLTNDGDASLTSIAIAASGPFQATSNCTTQLIAQSSCAIRVIFVPTAAGPQKGTLAVADIFRTQTVSLTGSGLLPLGFSVTPAHLDFGTQGLGRNSAPQTLTVSNRTASAASALSFVLTGPFVIAHNLCGSNLDAGASCTLDLQFQPRTVGTQTGSLTVSSSAAPAVKIPLAGIGFDFGLSIEGSSVRTVASGQTATYSVSLAPTPGITASFAFQCDALPSNVSCVFNPATNTIVGGAVASETVHVRTAPLFGRGASPPWSAPIRTVLLAGAIFFIRRRSRSARIFLAGVLFFLLVVSLTRCTSSGGGGTSAAKVNTDGAAAGTYTIPVTVTSMGMQHSVSLTLVVD